MLSARVSAFPEDVAVNRDLSDPVLWERSLRRSLQRRELTALSRTPARRAQKGTAVAVTAAVAAGQTALPVAAAAAATGAQSSGMATTARTAIHLPSTALLSEGDIGPAVAAVQRQVGVVADGIFGPITRRAVERFQARMGLPVTGEVDVRTWTALFKSNVSFVGNAGRRVLTVASQALAPSVATRPATPAQPQVAATPRVR